MNIHIHSSEEIDSLNNNPYVERCSAKSITYTYEFKKKGFEGLTEARGKGGASRLKIKELTDADKIKRLELQIKYLENENDFLARLRAKRAESNSGQKRNIKS